MLAKGDNKMNNEELILSIQNAEASQEFDFDTESNSLEDFESDEDNGDIGIFENEDDDVEFAEDFEPEDFIFDTDDDEDDDLEDFEPDEDDE